MKPRERKSIEHSISFSDLSDRRTEDTSWQNIWLLSFSVQSDNKKTCPCPGKRIAGHARIACRYLAQ
nr:MAG TPA: hypothetical protein [Caudoviricetes sp.]